jgi:DNA-binding beta-propeller fold protein YncE
MLGWGILLLCALVITSCGGSPPTGVTHTPTPTPIATISTSITAVERIGYVAAGDTAFWIHDNSNALVNHVDIAQKSVVATVPVGQGLGQIGIGPDAVWIVNGDDGTVTRIDPQTNRVAATIPLAPHIYALTVSPGAVWVANQEQKTVTRIDAQTNQVVATIATPPAPIMLSFGAGSVWSCNGRGGQMALTRIDPQTNQVLAQIDLGNAQGFACSSVLALSGVVWVLIFNTKTNRVDTLEQVDPATNQVSATISIPNADIVPQFAADEHGVWVCSDGDNAGLFRMNPQTGKIVGKLALDCSGVVTSAGSPWIINGAVGHLDRVTPAP